MGIYKRKTRKHAFDQESDEEKKKKTVTAKKKENTLSTKKASKKTKKFIGFFHPNCSSGGGGERVLWLMVCSLLREKNSCNNVDIVIYTGDLDSNEVDHVMLLEFVPFDYLFAPHLFACVLS